LEPSLCLTDYLSTTATTTTKYIFAWLKFQKLYSKLLYLKLALSHLSTFFR
jgi:hypothetical protein